MLEKPEIEEEEILNTLEQEYGLVVKEIVFLPLGADQSTAVYRVVTQEDKAYFLKLRSGEFNEASVSVPSYLSQRGINQVIPPLPTRSGRLHAVLDRFAVVLYPFVEGKNGFQRSLSEPQWREFGAAMKAFHTTKFPLVITRSIPLEEFSSQWRESVKKYLKRIEVETYSDPVARELADFLKSKSIELLDLVKRTEQLARMLQEQPLEFILCHGDIHAWNLLLTDNGAFYMVDWDTLILAPRERDLMFIGGGLGGRTLTPDEEETLFYEGYGEVQIDPLALTYYRYERILEDIAVYCDQLFSSSAGGEDRLQSLENVKSNFVPNGVLEIARRSDRTLRDN